ncbi:hypothetical protein [Anatilimnocola floriformis]|uniref:hypothetical protein n=1 Tax=Anatilimnocola floriformis TaxID=2948575 RepID=UPI0020C37167|nr:hypothetical protein [Anatilimnocola floriformis]
MNDLELRIEQYRADFKATTGKPFDHFYCPILMRDEQTEMCRGHVVADAFGTCGKWVPQRKDVDNFYGSVVEADLITVVEDRGKDPFRLWLEPNGRRLHRPRLEYDGTVWSHYFPQGDIPKVEGHTPILIEGSDGSNYKMVVKVPPSVLQSAENPKLSLIIERDYRPAVTASMLKAAHLTLFEIFGYEHVFRSSGQFLASILREFFDRFKSAKNVTEDDVADHFMKFERMISPIVLQDKTLLQGTITDRRFITCISTNKDVFALGVIVRAKDDMFCVFLPTDKSIDTYFSFLKEPPKSIAARITQFFEKDDKGGPRWRDLHADTLRLPLDQSMPDYFSHESNGGPDE